MSANSLWDVQVGVFNRLSGDAGLTTLLASGAEGIFDHAPPAAQLPYVVLGELSLREMDTHRGAGANISLAVHVYSKEGGLKEAKQIMGKVYEALHNASFVVPNYDLILCQFVDAEVRLEGDGATRHGVQRFQVVVEPV